MGSLKMSELSIGSIGAPQLESTHRSRSQISTPKTLSLTSLDLKKVPSNLSNKSDNRNHMINEKPINDHIGLIEKAHKLKKMTAEKLNNIGNKYDEINKQIAIEVKRLKAEAEADDLKIINFDREKEKIEVQNSELKKDIRRLESKLGETEDIENRCSTSQLENDETNNEIIKAKTTISELTKSLRLTAEELRNINDEREKLIAQNSNLKKERFEEEIALKDRNDVIAIALKELEDLERQLRLFNNAKSLHLLSL